MIRGGSFVVLMCKCIKCIDLICRGRISFSFLVFTYLQQLGLIYAMIVMFIYFFH